MVEDPNYLSNREFCFTLKDDIYIRYKSFSSEKEMKDEIVKLNPYKIDIGAVYTSKVSLPPRPPLSWYSAGLIPPIVWLFCSPRITSQSRLESSCPWKRSLCLIST